MAYNRYAHSIRRGLKHQWREQGEPTFTDPDGLERPCVEGLRSEEIIIEEGNNPAVLRKKLLTWSDTDPQPVFRTGQIVTFAENEYRIARYTLGAANSHAVIDLFDPDANQ